MVTLQESLRPHSRIGLDTSVFIYHIEAGSSFAAPATLALRHLEDPSTTGITSVLTLTELLVKPLQLERRGLAARYEALMRSIPGLTIVDIDSRIARMAAALRATYRLRTADALHVSACLEHGATAFVTNDAQLRRIDALAVVMLSDHVGE